ncbi:DUF6894 family protein [Alsobacter sp. SYSU BS001988]|jgi:hypothetical protein
MPRFHINIWRGRERILDIQGRSFRSEGDARDFALRECRALANDEITEVDRGRWKIELTDAASHRVELLSLPDCEQDNNRPAC